MKKVLKGFGIAFCITGIIVYTAMAFEADPSEADPALRPLMIFMVILMSFFLYLLIRKKKVKQQEETIIQQPILPSQNIRTSTSTTTSAEQFFVDHSTKIQSMERLTATPRMSDYGDVDAYREAYELALHALNELKEYCSRYPGGLEWFEEMYVHCSNSRNPDFSLVKQIEEGYNDLIENYDEYSRRFKAKQAETDYLLEHGAHIRSQIMSIVTAEQGFIQKDLYSNFRPDERSAVIKVLSTMVKEKVIYRKSYKNTFKLYTDPLKMNDE